MLTLGFFKAVIQRDLDVCVCRTRLIYLLKAFVVLLNKECFSHTGFFFILKSTKDTVEKFSPSRTSVKLQ